MTEKTIEQLKAEVYDLLVEQQKINLKLQEVNTQITKLEVKSSKTK